MIVYIEDCLIENFLVTFLCLNCVKAFFKLQIKKRYVFLASIFGAIISIFYPLFHITGIWLIGFKVCVGILICLIAFYSYKNLISLFLSFLFLTALYAGLNLMIYYLVYGTLNVTENFATYILLFILLGTYYFLMSLIKIIKKKYCICNFVYKIKIINDGQEFFEMGFLDSGNTLLDQDSTPIFIINKKLFNKLYKDITEMDIYLKNFKHLKQVHYIKSNFASGSSKMTVFCIDELVIESDKPKIFTNAKMALSFSNFDKNFNCNMLLNINAFC